MDTKVPLYEIPVPSTDLLRSPRFEDLGGRAVLSYEYLDSGASIRGGIEFENVRAYRHRAEIHCTGWHIDGAYDTLVEIKDSRWAAEVRQETAKGWKTEWALHHYLIYLDSAGAYEVLAESWSEVTK